MTLSSSVASRDVVVRGRILRWGNSYGIRLRREDLEKAGLSPGSEAVVRVARPSERVDLSSLPTFRGGRDDDSLRHDEILARARVDSLRKRKA